MNRIVAISLAAAGILTPELARAQDAAPLDFFERRIRPVLVNHCYECHSTASKKKKGGLLLDTHDGLLKGGTSGPALVVGEPEKSLLIRAVRRIDKDLQMPPRQKLTAMQIDDLVAWVKMGAPDPRQGTTVKAPTRMPLEEDRKFWSFQPIKEPSLPKVKDAAWPRTGVDHFILARLSYGQSDDHGIGVAEDGVHINDFHATILHLLGLDHERLTYRHAGRDFRLTDVAGHVAHKIIA